MKKGTVAFAVLAVSMLIIAMPVYAKEKEVVELPSTQIDLEETIELPNGWHEENGKKYYVVDHQFYKGEKKIDGSWYYFDEFTGEMRTGFVDHHDKSYYYNNQGQMQYGEKKIEGNWYYFHQVTGVMKKGWVTYHNKNYYYNENGHMLHGKAEVEGQNYYFDSVTGVLKTGWNVEGEKKYYCTATGNVKGEKKIGGNWYYFDEETREMRTGFVTHHSNQYYYDKQGHMQYGEKKIGGNWYYFHPVTGVMKKGWVTHHNKNYYYNENGHMLHGKAEVEGQNYYFDSVTGVLKIGWNIEGEKKYYCTATGNVKGEKKIGGNWYYFDEETREMKTGFVTHHSNQYYYDKQGRMQYGEKKIEGNWYYFHPVTGVMKKGWTTHHNKVYFYDENGCMYHDWNTIDGIEYYFDSITGVFCGWIKENGIVYYSVDGKHCTGEKKIEGNWYYFIPEENGEMATGWCEHHGYTYWYDADGKMKYGWQEIEGQNYYFHDVRGILIPEWRKDEKGIYYIDNTNSVSEKVVGEKKIDGYWYYFDPQKDGAMATGWISHHGNKYYYSDKGRMLYGKQRIGQYYYYFDPVRGTMCAGWITINKKLYYFYKDGKMAVNTVVDHMTVGPDGVAIDNIVFKINDIMKYEGAPYRYGGTTPKGWDCSGFTQWALKYMGASIPRTAAQQGAAGLYIPKNNRSAWKPGDILCYKNGGRVSHVALYLGNGKIMHALSEKWDTLIQDVDYYERWDSKTKLSHVRRYL